MQQNAQRASSSSSSNVERPVAKTYKFRKCSANQLKTSYTVSRFPDKLDFTKFTPPILIRKKGVEDDQIDLAETGETVQQLDMGKKSDRQLEREKKREEWAKRARERKREYIMEDKDGKLCYEGRCEAPQSSRYGFLQLLNDEFIYIPVNEDWVHFRQRISIKKFNTSESVEKAIKKSEDSSNARMKGLVSESSAMSTQFRDEQKPARGRGGGSRGGVTRRKVKGEDEDMEEIEIDEGGEHFDFEGGMDDDEEYMDAAIENPISEQLLPEDLYSDSESDSEELSSSGKQLKELLDELREGRKKKPEAEPEVKPEVKKEDAKEEKPADQVKEEEESPDAKKRGRGRPRKTDKKPAKQASPSSSTTTPPATSSSSAQKRKSDTVLGTADSRPAKKAKTEDVADPAELKKDILNLFQKQNQMLVKDFMALYLKNVKRSKDQKKERMKLLSQILNEISVTMQKMGDGNNYFVLKK
jgi:hypothetical protein